MIRLIPEAKGAIIIAQYAVRGTETIIDNCRNRANHDICFFFFVHVAR